jgi:methylated-DNA-protein-cysteine methyltransferase related protein
VSKPLDSFARVRRVVAKIPRGRVMTYGAVAIAAGMPGAARTVGYAMRSFGRDVPWQRVLGRKNPRTAQITIRDPRSKAEQRRLLEKEGVAFDARGGVSLLKYGYAPKPAKT